VIIVICKIQYAALKYFTQMLASYEILTAESSGEDAEVCQLPEGHAE